MNTRGRRRAVMAFLLSVAVLGIVMESGAVAHADPGAPAAPGRVVAWGGAVGEQAALTPPTDLVDAVAVVASDVYNNPYDLALRGDGTVVGWGHDSFGEAHPPAGLRGVVGLDTGAGFSVAVKSDGSVVTWGNNWSGQLDVPIDASPAIAVSAGGYRGVSGVECGYALALRRNGTVARWGRQSAGQGCYDGLDAKLDPPAGLTGVIAIAAGERHALALRSDGTVVGWGDNGVGQASPPAGLAGVVAIAAGSDHSLALTADGTVMGWGVWGESGPPHLAGVAAVSSAVADVFLRRDGSLYVYGNGFDGLSSPPAGTDFTAVSAGYGHGLAIQRVAANLVGAAQVQPNVDSNPAGTAEAFRYVATATGSGSRFSVYLDQGSTATQVIAGVYADAGGRPGRLLATGTTMTPTAGGWTTVALPATSIRAGTAYWLAVLAPTKAGTLRFRDRPDGQGGPTQTSQAGLTSKSGLPATWKPGTTFANAPASIYLQ